jgi:nucleoside-diphosphate-sugar epimerase
MHGKRILVTGASGMIARAVALRLAERNEVFGAARFGDEAVRAELAKAGVRICPVDLVGEDWSALPESVDHVLHLAAYLGPNPSTDHSLEINAVATGRLLSRYRAVESVLVMSTCGVYRAHPDPWHRYVETDPLGDPASPASPAYGITKVAQEAVARFCAREFDLRIVIGRMNVAYGAGAGLPARHLDKILAGEPIVLRTEEVPYSPVHTDDITDHLGPLLAAATSPALVVNFGGDTVVSSREWCTYLGELVGREPRFEIAPLPGSQVGIVADNTRRLALTGPDAVDWRTGMRELVETRR